MTTVIEQSNNGTQIEVGNDNGDSVYEEIFIEESDGYLQPDDDYTDTAAIEIRTSEPGYINESVFRSEDNEDESNLPDIVADSSHTYMRLHGYVNQPAIPDHADSPSSKHTISKFEQNQNNNQTISFATDSDYSGYPWSDSEFSEYPTSLRNSDLPGNRELVYDQYECKYNTWNSNIDIHTSRQGRQNGNAVLLENTHVEPIFTIPLYESVYSGPSSDNRNGIQSNTREDFHIYELPQNSYINTISMVTEKKLHVCNNRTGCIVMCSFLLLAVVIIIIIATVVTNQTIDSEMLADHGGGRSP